MIYHYLTDTSLQTVGRVYLSNLGVNGLTELLIKYSNLTASCSLVRARCRVRKWRGSHRGRFHHFRRPADTPRRRPVSPASDSPVSAEAPSSPADTEPESMMSTRSTASGPESATDSFIECGELYASDTPDSSRQNGLSLAAPR